MAVSVDPAFAQRLDALGRRLGLGFIRVFGSYARDPEGARDLDVVAGAKRLSLAERSELESMLQEHFGRPVDLVEFHPGMGPHLTRAINAESVPLWEHPDHGREEYAVLIDRFLAIAEDELLAYPADQKQEDFERTQRRLRGT